MIERLGSETEEQQEAAVGRTLLILGLSSLNQ